MCSVSAAWVGATHLLKSTFRTVHHVAAVLVVQHVADSSAAGGANHSAVATTLPATSTTTTTTPIYPDIYPHHYDDVSVKPNHHLTLYPRTKQNQNFLAGFSNRCRTQQNLDRKIIHVLPTRFVCCYSQSTGPPPFTFSELYHQTCVSYEPPIVHDDMTRKIYKPLSQRPSVAHHRWSKSFASKVEFELLLISANIC